MTYFIFPGSKKPEPFLKTILYKHKECIINAILQHFGITFEQMVQRYRGREIAFPRMVCMYTMTKNTRIGSVSIGKTLGYHHTTVLNAVRTIQNLIDTEESTRKEIFLITDRLNDNQTQNI
jgi:chromosomal replication initiation ATPase DnaA